MRRTIASLAAVCLLAWAPAAAWAQASTSGSQDLLQVLVDSANTPAQHQALARYFRARAAEAKALAETHQAMSRSYSGKPGEIRSMNKHCDQIAKLNQELAAQYESLAKAEEAAAGK
jgi:2-polyprenyl-6-methoxyphenol hydroxylase-like FAD-dependent oxidoreductase